MHCFMCFSSDGNLQIFESDMDNDTVKTITCVLPDLLIPESMDPLFICSTCLEQISFFYTIKKESLQNCNRLKYFSAMLKETNNVKCNELKVILNSNDVLTHRKHHLQDDKSSCSNDDSTQHHVNVGSFEFVDTNKFTEEDFNLTSKNSPQKDQLKIHCENEKKIFKCTDCHKAFAQRSNLKTHIRVHTGEKPYKCTICQKTFKQSSVLKTHAAIHRSKNPHECDVCPKSFTNKSHLIIHKRIHNNVRPFQCGMCSKGFIQTGDLNRHMLTHTGDKPHQCHICEYKSTTTSALKVHIRCHTGEKPYSCKHCEKSFTSSSDLKRHERSRHNNEDTN